MPVTAQTDPTPRDSLLQGKRVLLVEDDFLVALEAVQILERLGLQVIGPFARLADGHAAARNDAFDFAMLDLNLHGQQSYPIANTLAERRIPFFFASGYQTHGWRGDAPNLTKPYAAHEVEQMLLSLLTRTPEIFADFHEIAG